MATGAEKPTFKGSCHCGFVTYTVAIDPNNRSASRCNCTWCQKPAFTNLTVDRKDFTLLTPSSEGEMADYNPKGSDAHRYFCGRCGTHVLREVSLQPRVIPGPSCSNKDLNETLTRARVPTNSTM